MMARQSTVYLLWTQLRDWVYEDDLELIAVFVSKVDAEKYVERHPLEDADYHYIISEQEVI